MRIPGTMLAMAARMGQMFLIVVIASAGARWRLTAEAVEWRGASQNEQDTHALDPNKPIERELAGGQVHAYRITLAAGQYLRVVVDQRGIDVVVALFGPDGKKLAEIDSPNGAKGPEHLSVVAKVPGNHRLEVRSLEKSAAAGRYEAKITALRDATQEDKAEDFARRLAEAKTEAERTALLAEKELATEKLAQALNKLGDGLMTQGNYGQALTLFRLSQKIAEQIGDKAGIARSLNYIGNVHYSQGNYAQALEYHQKSFGMCQ
jgi:tetratricopeptide (TPR) repeat protein